MCALERYALVCVKICMWEIEIHKIPYENCFAQNSLFKSSQTGVHFNF